MQGNANKIGPENSDTAIIAQIGEFIRQRRAQRSLTQAKLAERAGLNRYTISQIETGESITLTSLIQILRALDALYVLAEFETPHEISPLEYAKLKRKNVKRVREVNDGNDIEGDLAW